MSDSSQYSSEGELEESALEPLPPEEDNRRVSSDSTSPLVKRQTRVSVTVPDKRLSHDNTDSPISGRGSSHISRNTVTGTVPRNTVTGALPRNTATGALPRNTATGALPRNTATGAVPRNTATGAVPRKTATGGISRSATTDLSQRSTVSDASPSNLSNRRSSELIVPQNQRHTTTQSNHTPFESHSFSIDEQSQSYDSSDNESDENEKGKNISSLSKSWCTSIVGQSRSSVKMFKNKKSMITVEEEDEDFCDSDLKKERFTDTTEKKRSIMIKDHESKRHTQKSVHIQSNVRVSTQYYNISENNNIDELSLQPDKKKTVPDIKKSSILRSSSKKKGGYSLEDIKRSTAFNVKVDGRMTCQVIHEPEVQVDDQEPDETTLMEKMALERKKQIEGAGSEVGEDDVATIFATKFTDADPVTAHQLINLIIEKNHESVVAEKQITEKKNKKIKSKMHNFLEKKGRPTIAGRKHRALQELSWISAISPSAVPTLTDRKRAVIAKILNGKDDITLWGKNYLETFKSVDLITSNLENYLDELPRYDAIHDQSKDDVEITEDLTYEMMRKRYYTFKKKLNLQLRERELTEKSLDDIIFHHKKTEMILNETESRLKIGEKITDMLSKLTYMLPADLIDFNIMPSKQDGTIQTSDAFDLPYTQFMEFKIGYIPNEGYGHAHLHEASHPTMTAKELGLQGSQTQKKKYELNIIDFDNLCLDIIFTRIGTTLTRIFMRFNYQKHAPQHLHGVRKDRRKGRTVEKKEVPKRITLRRNKDGQLDLPKYDIANRLNDIENIGSRKKGQKHKINSNISEHVGFFKDGEEEEEDHFVQLRGSTFIGSVWGDCFLPDGISPFSEWQFTYFLKRGHQKQYPIFINGLKYFSTYSSTNKKSTTAEVEPSIEFARIDLLYRLSQQDSDTFLPRRYAHHFFTVMACITKELITSSKVNLGKINFDGTGSVDDIKRVYEEYRIRTFDGYDRETRIVDFLIPINCVLIGILRSLHVVTVRQVCDFVRRVKLRMMKTKDYVREAAGGKKVLELNSVMVELIILIDVLEQQSIASILRLCRALKNKQNGMMGHHVNEFLPEVSMTLEPSQNKIESNVNPHTLYESIRSFTEILCEDTFYRIYAQSLIYESKNDHFGRFDPYRFAIMLLEYNFNVHRLIAVHKLMPYVSSYLTRLRIDKKEKRASVTRRGSDLEESEKKNKRKSGRA